MNYLDLNEYNKKRISQTCSSDVYFEWEDTDFMGYLMGELPKLRANDIEGQTPRRFYELLKVYRSYEFMETEADTFLQQIKSIADDICAENPYWYGLNFPLVKDVLHYHKSCLIAGEGGIGKSYFIKCYEEELTKNNIKHLCVYGKFSKSISQIDFDEIVSIGENEEFVFVFDAINEVEEDAQEALLKELKRLKLVRGIRIAITYRLHTMDEGVLQSYKETLGIQYDFPGVSFESAIEWLRKMPIEDITEYLDVLYSNNPFLLGKLRYIMESGWDNSRNNVSRFTYIYEQYIKRTLSQPIWLQTKKVAEFMYHNAKKEISINELHTLLGDCKEFLLDMERFGFFSRFTYDGTDYYTFLIESLSDYLIARSMWEDLDHKSEQECVRIIKDKIERIHSIKEMVILILFDLYSADYEKIKRILVKTNLADEFGYDLIVKIHFTPESIKRFLKCFSPTRPGELIEYFAGYPNKPFNCTFYLNNYYINTPQAQTVELSRQLSKKHFLHRLISRLKNALYLVCKCECNDERLRENFYTALWCTSSGNQTVRLLGEKLLYDVLQRCPTLIPEAITLFPQITDFYIREALIYSLSSCQYRQDIANFFDVLLAEPDFTMATSIRRMCEYLGKPEYYIELDKLNLLSGDNQVVSEEFEHILFSIDLFEKELLPFRFMSTESFQQTDKFLAADKTEVAAFNLRVYSDFNCVRGGACSGSMSFRRDVEEYYSISLSENLFSGRHILASLERTFQTVFLIYGLQLNYADIRKQDEQEFSASLFRKCTCIAIDTFYGSLMCNYYLRDFATFNNLADTIGFEIYNPTQYGEKINLKSPLPVYHSNVEKMGDFFLSKLDIPKRADESWWSNLDSVKSNILQLLTPIKYKKHEWILLAGRISIRGEAEGNEWRDTYDLFCCTSSEETLKNDGNERYLTIELDDYTGNLFDYPNSINRPWLCKRVPPISYGSAVFEETMLTLPPAMLITALGLKLNFTDMYWEDENGDAIIICNNNMSSYYRDPIMSTVFIRKDVFDRIEAPLQIKFFAFSERFMEPMGYCDDTAMHFEIIDGEIVKSILNSDANMESFFSNAPERCLNCKFGFYKSFPRESDFENLLENNPEIASLFSEYGLDEL